MKADASQIARRRKLVASFTAEKTFSARWTMAKLAIASKKRLIEFLAAYERVKSKHRKRLKTPPFLFLFLFLSVPCLSNVRTWQTSLVQFLHGAISALYLLGRKSRATIYLGADFQSPSDTVNPRRTGSERDKIRSAG